MEYIDNLFINDDFDNHQLLSETPIGWSSMCFDQTINYYIEYNSVNINNNELKNNEEIN